MIGIVSHDSGGAELLSSWVVKNNHKKKFLFSLSGPALRIFKSKIKNIKNRNINFLIEHVDKLVTSTSWPPRNEMKAIKLSKKKKIFCSSYLDHWTNYEERFTQNNKIYLPNEIWVGDKIAQKIATKKFSKTKIKYVKNEFFESVKNKKYHKQMKKKKILLLSTPIAKVAKIKFNNYLHFGFTELDAINIAIEKIKNSKFYYDKIVIRPHPSENSEKFKKLVKRNILISNEKDVIKDISSSEIVIGYNSMAMIIAKLMKKKVYSCLPKGKVKNTLPINFKEL